MKNVLAVVERVIDRVYVLAEAVHDAPEGRGVEEAHRSAENA